MSRLHPHAVYITLVCVRRVYSEYLISRTIYHELEYRQKLSQENVEQQLCDDNYLNEIAITLMRVIGKRTKALQKVRIYIHVYILYAPNDIFY